MESTAIRGARPEPFKLIVSSALSRPLLLTVTSEVRGPAAVGAQITVTGEEAPGASSGTGLTPVIAKSQLRLIVMELSITGLTAPALLLVTFCAAVDHPPTFP